MSVDLHYRRDERFILRLLFILGITVCVSSFLLADSRTQWPEESISPEAVWGHINDLAPIDDLDPEFVYALAWAESSLNANARSSVARGIMQMTRSAWQEVTDESYRYALDWRTNIRVAIRYLVYCRTYLQKHDNFSYPLLAACYRYGPYRVKSKNFDIRQLPEPENKIYKRIFSGDIRPVQPPVSGHAAMSVDRTAVVE